MIKRLINTLFLVLVFSVFTNAQNPISYTAERTDNSGATLNLKNVNGFWHFSGPRSYESNNKLSLFWNDGTYHRILSINDNGNVGIGTTNPTNKLQINGSVRVGDGNWGALVIDGKDENDWLFNAHNDGATLAIRTQLNGQNAWSHQVMTLNRVSGNVGIGTTNPQERFQIGNSYIFHDGGHKVIAFLHRPSGGVDLDASKYAGEIRFDPTTGYMRLGTSSTVTDGPITRFSISKDGKVGIGNLNTGNHRLAVEGSIGAREVKVEVSGWSDYVFQEDHDLPTLEEVEIHIKEKGHLINIPSAREVEENGIQLGVMNKLLLEKIEELTLYTLQQQKEISLLKKEVQNLKNHDE